MTIRHAQPQEAEMLSDLALRSKSHWGYSKAFLDKCRAELSLSHEYIQQHHVYVLDVDNAVVGFYALVLGEENSVELESLFLEPNHIGKGWGRILLEDAKVCARSLQATTMIIHSDPYARQFYEAVGGVVIKEIPSGSIAGRMLPMLELAL